MSRFFNFYDPLEKRYIFNSFLVVAALVEVLILVFTLIWQIDEGVFGGSVKVVPFPWKEYLLASFTAPIALVFIFGLIVQGFEMMGGEGETSKDTPGALHRRGRVRYFLGLLALLAFLVLLFKGGLVLELLTAGVKALGLGGSYLLIGLLALALLYLPLRLMLRYRLQKKAMEYQYLLTLAEKHGVAIIDPCHPESLIPPGEGQKKLAEAVPPPLSDPQSEEGGHSR
ncbi:MAG: hypothetical protein FJ134_01815 [Deltaproteobacteria bacterium]|nr:hypothetical protein [Deltaproteobacteria bacterium]